jgi:hypothetical protein
MIKYNVINKFCVISESEWINKYGEKMIPHRNCDWEERVDTHEDIKRPYFKEEGTTKFNKKITKFKDSEKILPYLVSRFGLKNIYIRYNNENIRLISDKNLYNSLIREEKLNELLNKY